MATYMHARFKIPDGLDLEDSSVVKDYYVIWRELHIEYTDGRTEKIEEEYGGDDVGKYPIETLIEDADDHDIYYTADEESDEEED